MLRGFFFFLKFLIVATFILILGNLLQFNGKTISDQVKIQIAHAQRSALAYQFKKWAGQVSEDVEKGIHRKFSHGFGDVVDGFETPKTEKIPVTEQEKLKSLIRKLNQATE